MEIIHIVPRPLSCYHSIILFIEIHSLSINTNWLSYIPPWGGAICGGTISEGPIGTGPHWFIGGAAHDPRVFYNGQ